MSDRMNINLASREDKTTYFSASVCGDFSGCGYSTGPALCRSPGETPLAPPPLGELNGVLLSTEILLVNPCLTPVGDGQSDVLGSLVLSLGVKYDIDDCLLASRDTRALSGNSAPTRGDGDEV